MGTRAKREGLGEHETVGPLSCVIIETHSNTAFVKEEQNIGKEMRIPIIPLMKLLIILCHSVMPQ